MARKNKTRAQISAHTLQKISTSGSKSSDVKVSGMKRDIYRGFVQSLDDKKRLHQDSISQLLFVCYGYRKALGKNN